MSKDAFNKIAEGLNEALAVARGAKTGARVHVPAEIDVKAIRDKIKMSQDVFASSFGFSVHQVRQWEQGRHRPLGAMRAYLLAIERAPSVILNLLAGNQDQSKAA
jgi:putative transcriptional regulator